MYLKLLKNWVWSAERYAIYLHSCIIIGSRHENQNTAKNIFWFPLLKSCTFLKQKLAKLLFGRIVLITHFYLRIFDSFHWTSFCLLQQCISKYKTNWLWYYFTSNKIYKTHYLYTIFQDVEMNFNAHTKSAINISF